MEADLAAGRMELHDIRTETEQRDAMRANIVSKRRQEILDLAIQLTKMSASEEDRQMALEHTAALEALDADEAVSTQVWLCNPTNCTGQLLRTPRP